MSFGGGSGVTGSTNGWSVSTQQLSAAQAYGNAEEPGKPGMLEVVAGLSRDCFIIPLACVDRFLPAGLTVIIHDSVST